MFRVLGKAESRVKDQLFGLHTGCHERIAQGAQFVDDFGDDIAVVGLGHHRRRVPAAVHQHVRCTGFGDQLGHVCLVGQPGDVVDDVGTGSKCCTRRGGVHGVNGDDRPGLGQRGDDRDDAGALGGGLHRFGTWAG